MLGPAAPIAPNTGGGGVMDSGKCRSHKERGRKMAFPEVNRNRTRPRESEMAID